MLGKIVLDSQGFLFPESAFFIYGGLGLAF